MTESRNPLLEKLDPSAESVTRSLVGGAIRTQAVYVVAKLGIADLLSLGPRTAGDLAQRTNANAEALRRVLRFLVFNGLFAENEDGTFALNRAAESLQAAHPRSLRPSAIRAGEGLWKVSSLMLEAVVTGNTPHDALHGKPFFERIAEERSEGSFASRMSGSSAGLGDAISHLECVKRARSIIDVGGGHGALLADVLRANTSVRGVLFDRAATIETARPFLQSAGVLERCELVAGDFFDGVPGGGDVYLLSWVLHDWDDESASRILRACGDAARDDSTLLIVEVLLPPHTVAAEGSDPGLIADPYTLDLQMLLLTGGRERTAREYDELLRAAGWKVMRMTPVASQRGATVIQAGAAQVR